MIQEVTGIFKEHESWKQKNELEKIPSIYKKMWAHNTDSRNSIFLTLKNGIDWK